MTFPLNVADDIPGLLKHVQKLAQELWPEEEWTQDRDSILRGALNFRLSEYQEQLMDRAQERGRGGE